MEKRKLRILTVVVFAGVLIFGALRQNSTGRGELGEIQVAMWNLGKVDNLQLSYEYRWKQNGSAGGETMHAWADMLTGDWISDHYPTDEDGTRLYLKQFCDGRNLYHYIDWSGEWEQILPQQRENTVIPDYEMVTDLGYDGTDVEDLERVTEDGAVEITCSFTQEYLEEAWENQVAQVEKSYAFYEKSGADGDAVKTAALSVQQHKQAHYEDMTATYVIDENQILRSMEYQITLIMPEITQDLSGNKMLGKDRKMQITVTAEVDRYNQGGIANKVQQYKTLVQEYME